MSAAPSPRARLSGALVAAAILIAAAALRFGMLGFEGVWCDEAYTGGMVRAPLSSMLGDLITRDDAPPLFYLVARLGVAVAGDSEAGLRLVPALAGLAAVALLLARARARRDASLVWAAGFFAVAAYAVFHARQARSYGLLFLFALLLIIAARDLLLERRRRSGPTLALAGGALVLTHNIGVVLVLASLALWPLR
ncbi:MAG: glycosyltransferase family 39 protein, partial [Candidatus Eisenbacteria bacterium]|nr:glycosyltransferase family 39 protein [Candidatus Eisenbacteria bacterium]